MRKIVFATLGILALASAVAAQSNAVQTAADTLGAARIKTLQFTGSGQNFSVGQNYTPAEPWPPVTVKNYTASINYDTGSMRAELVQIGRASCRERVEMSGVAAAVMKTVTTIL